jgi:hypothetical protein
MVLAASTNIETEQITNGNLLNWKETAPFGHKRNQIACGFENTADAGCLVWTDCGRAYMYIYTKEKKFTDYMM